MASIDRADSTTPSFNEKATVQMRGAFHLKGIFSKVVGSRGSEGKHDATKGKAFFSAMMCACVNRPKS